MASPTRRSSDVTIAAATDVDLPGVARLADVIWRAHYPGIITDEQIDYMLARGYSIDALAKFLHEPGAGLAIARAGGEPVGFAAWYRPDEPATTKLDKLYVLPSQHGRGTGRALIAHVEAAARARRRADADPQRQQAQREGDRRATAPAGSRCARRSSSTSAGAS